ncbi:uncharacterized protein CLUP02_03181 [Colletotrichum lupini]|uniref:Uncharacterized protein n=1 Tax=Colletotrichum lupini TaxID=145971 RepID=A0A9Q8SIR3_9PEZI|nr:uncharacterized protein CLUP02_03181 [Colletotrichum lupini]UQC77710.1 hypothetical protein CLUP02_03181 [Colletotrichum lupini]
MKSEYQVVATELQVQQWQLTSLNDTTRVNVSRKAQIPTAPGELLAPPQVPSFLQLVTFPAPTVHAPAASHTSKVEGQAPLVAAELHTKIPGISKSVARADHSRPNKRADPVAFRQRDSFAASPHLMTSTAF